MAHFILEYSSNLNKSAIDISGLFEKLHHCVVNTGLFPIAGLRSRAYPSEDYRVADGNPNFGFAHLKFHIGPGRSDHDKENALSLLTDIIKDHFNPIIKKQGIAISFEITELPQTLRVNINNLRNYL